MDWLKEVIAKHIEDAGKVDEIINDFKKESGKHLIPKSTFNEVNEKAKSFESQLSENTKQLSEKTAKLTEYENKFVELNTTIEKVKSDSMAQLQKVNKTVKVKELLSSNGAIPSAIDLLVEKYVDSVELDGENIKDADKFIESVRKDRDSLFSKNVKNSNDKGGGGGDPDPIMQKQAELRSIYGLSTKNGGK